MRLLLVLALAFLIYAHQTMGMSTLEETSWEVRVGRTPFFPFAPKDTLSFGRGRFVSARFLADGYSPSGYGPAAGGDWHARQKSSDGGVMEWRGKVSGDRIRGTVTVTRADGAAKIYKFRGRRRGV
ncbi:MAG: hypothetical protein HYZ75_05665 [Elusimicrobia bacterium]|nr:hypothetical protein [Elusimicrobiota bacterium]